jgi:hypothetical protein
MNQKTLLVNIIFLIAIAILVWAGFYYFSNNDFDFNEKEDLIKVENPQPSQEISSPIVITGEARGSWFFEASFPIKLLDEDGNIIQETFAQAEGDWMTEEFVPFESVMIFSISGDQDGTLVLEKDNPSGLPENKDEIRIPVRLVSSESEEQLREIKLYYYNPDLDKDNSGNILCSEKGLVAVDREIPVTNTPIQDTIRLLISGDITQNEQEQGISTEYPLEGFELTSASVNEKVLTLTFDDPNNKTGGGSCRAGILWSQINKTALQFDEVTTVRFMPEELFQP